MHDTQGTSEAALFSLSGGERIPKLTAVLLGMVPVTIDVIVRVFGYAFVFVFVPMVGVIGLLGNLLTSLSLSWQSLQMMAEDEDLIDDSGNRNGDTITFTDIKCDNNGNNAINHCPQGDDESTASKCCLTRCINNPA